MRKAKLLIIRGWKGHFLLMNQANSQMYSVHVCQTAVAEAVQVQRHFPTSLLTSLPWWQVMNPIWKTSTVNTKGEDLRDWWWVPSLSFTQSRARQSVGYSLESTSTRGVEPSLSQTIPSDIHPSWILQLKDLMIRKKAPFFSVAAFPPPKQQFFFHSESQAGLDLMSSHSPNLQVHSRRGPAPKSQIGCCSTSWIKL